MEENKNDSELETLRHIKLVNSYLIKMAQDLLSRAAVHDASKLVQPEKEGFDSVVQKLSNCEYGSPEYDASLKELKTTLDHHYRNNSHHPEHFERGVDDMSLLDLIEMFCDWLAAGERNKGGSIFNSINKNKIRFEMTDQLNNIFKNTAERFKV